jgi:hypothetical protein
MVDRQLISFPKSGRTWLRFALHQLGMADQIDFHHDGFEYNDAARPQLDVDFAKRLERYSRPGRFIYLERDPRDVMVSLYYQITGRFSDIFNYRGSISDFIRDPYFGAPNLQQFRSQWRSLCDRGLALRISYEDCHADLPSVLEQVVAYYGLQANQDAIASAAARSAFESMSEIEQSSAFDQPWLRPRNGAPKVRRGLVGGYVDSLPQADILFLDEIFLPDTP